MMAAPLCASRFIRHNMCSAVAEVLLLFHQPQIVD